VSSSWLKKLVRKPERARSHRLPGYRPRIESLEDRTVPSFFTPTNYAVGTTPHGEAVGDFNGDGKADLVVVNQGANTLSVLLGNGNGTFQPRTDYATGTSPWGVAVGDVNGDGKADVVVVNKGSNSLSVFLGNGDGTFQPKTDIAIPPVPVTLIPVVPTAVTVGDVNGDGKADLAVATHTTTQEEMTLLLGNGNGTFQAPVSTVTDTVPFIGGVNLGVAVTGQASIQSADLNGDGHPDLVVVNNKDLLQATLIGRGGVVVQSAIFPEPGSVSVLLGNGDGTFQAPRNFAVGSGAQSVAVGDFNGDGRLDFAVNNSTSNTVSVFTNSGSGNFAAASFSFATGGAGLLAAGDFNGDGATDLAAGPNILNGQTGTGLQAGARYALPLTSPVAADFNGDGHIDLAGAVGNAIEPWLNNGDGTFPAPTFIPAAGVTLGSQATADFNGDGIPDLVTASTGRVQLGLGDGRFGDPTTLSFPAGSTVAAVDADGNGTTDVLVSSPSYPTGQVAAWLNSPGYDNRTGGAVGFTVSAPIQIAAGSNTSVTVTAVDALGNPVPGFLGTVDLDNTPAGSTALNLSGQYTFTAADNGRHTFLFSNLTQAGADTLSTYAVGMPTATASVTVVPAATAKFIFATPAAVTAGTPFSYTVTAEDKFGNVETGYAGTVHFAASSADTQAVLPADYTFTAADAGVHTFTATLFRTQSIISPTVPSLTATDTATHVSSTASLAVLSLAPNSLALVNVPNPTTAGSARGVVVAALDVYGNAATGYAGTVHFSSSDVQAGLPADYTFTPADQGAHVFAVTLKTAGTQTLAVADTANPAFASQASVSVLPALPTAWAVSGLSATGTAGVAQTFTLTAMDAFGNVATNYFGVVHFSSSDSQAVLPPDTLLSTADAGRHTFTVTLKTAGPQTLTIADTFTTGVTATESIAVTPAAASALQVTGFPATTAGVAHSFTVTARDAFGNVASGYTGTVAFTSSDPIASLPANYTFTAADAGVHTFTAALKRAGTQSITVTDTAVAGLASTEGGIAVSAAAVTHFLISGPTSVTQGVGFKITVSAVDDFGNVNAGYRGSVHLSSTDPTGGTQNFTFSNNDNGVHIFSYTFNALGFQTITITDLSNSSIIGSIIEDVLPKN
jgi:FG-GAP-like repeat/FG-GAP repeat